MNHPEHALPVVTNRSFPQLGVVALALAAALSSIPSAQAAPATWVGNNNAQWSDTTGNWTGGLGTGGQPASGDSLIFGAAGTAGATLTDDLMTPGTFNIAGITFSSSAAAYTFNPNTSGTNGFTLTGGATAITNSSAVTQTINDLITLANAAQTVTLTSATDVVKLGGNISAAGTASNITTSGLGTLILSGNNSFGTGTGGGVTVGNGTTLQLQANGSNTASSISTALNTASGKLIFASSAGNSSTLQLRSDLAVTFAGGDGTTIFGATGTAPQYTIDVNNLTGSGSNNVISFGAGGLNYSGSNGQSATVNVTGGNGYSLALGTITDTSGASAGKSLKLNPTTANVAVAGFNNTTAGGARTLILDGTSTGNTIGTVLQNPAATTNLTKSNTSTWTITGAGTYTGTTSITGGTLKVGNLTALGTSTIGGSTGTLDVNGFAITNAVQDKALNGATLTNTGAAVDLTGMGTFGASTGRTMNLDGTGNITFGQAITGSYTIIKNGTNTIILGGTNTYNGGTTINGGAIFVNGSVSSGVTVNAGSFGGSGTTNSAVTIGNNTGSADAFLRAGGVGAVGTFTTTNATTLNSDAVFAVDFNSGTALFDKLVTASLTLNAAATLSLNDLGSSTLSLGQTFTIIDNTGGASIASTFAGLAEGATITSGANTFQISYLGGTGNDITLTTVASAIPEPSTYAAIMGLLTVGFVVVRRRRRTS